MTGPDSGMSTTDSRAQAFVLSRPSSSSLPFLIDYVEILCLVSISNHEPDFHCGWILAFERRGAVIART